MVKSGDIAIPVRQIAAALFGCRRSSALRSFALACSAAFFAATAIPSAAQQADASREQRFHIPAQPLNLALAQFATDSGVDILYDHKLAEGRNSVSVDGRFTPQIAIAMLLNGSGLVSRFVQPKSALVFLASRPDTIVGGRDQLRGPSLDLDTVRVQASPLVGTEYPAKFLAYGRATQTEIYEKLKTDPQMRGAVFRIKIRLKLDGDGRITALSFIEGSGDQVLDRHILAVLDGAHLSMPPPANLPQPLRFEIGAQ